ncbi:hypothetical protein [Phenylobacterium montanum]|uniref:Uncharacterized protein n=1 Tax=Phenylobacterium montanum TaxID=2823693 RepID=A0A975FXC6_9CAUL|nr:hypothetical protein [Caulobacter sp. S6]QUD86974.1 hypothetical protein KCG34_18125 [Caulobacter sp. S6]
MHDTADDDCTCERERQSEHSPSVVDSGEMLGRLIYADDQVEDATGNLKPGAFPLADVLDAKRGGWSFARLAHSTPASLLAKGKEFEDKKPDGNRRFRGVGKGLTGDVRAIAECSPNRDLCLIDDGLPDDPAHAAAVLSPSAPRSKSDLKAVRDKMLEIFSPVASPDDAF